MTSFQEKELAILRDVVDKAQEITGRKLLHSEDVQKIIRILENFIRKNKLVCYGGTAINNILPSDDQFYNKDSEIPDYDFFSPKALYHAKELADLYSKEGYDDVEAKSGVHHGTFKVFVNFIPIADITSLPKELFKTIQHSGLNVNGIKYAPPDYLRMSMYLELSRPKGDVSRWEKVLKRLVLLNKNYPMMNPLCDKIEFMRSFEGSKTDAVAIYNIVKDSAVDQGLVFFGGFASKMYSKYMPALHKDKLNNSNPDFDILSEDPLTSATIIKERLQAAGFHNIKIIKRAGLGEIISPHCEIVVDKDTVAFIYKPLACHSYNVITIKGKKVKIATIDTMLSFYLAFLYANRPYYDHDRIYCMSQYLFLVQSKNRLQQKGVLKRFSLQCIGTQATLSDMRNEKNEKYKELKYDRTSDEYNEWFLRYTPNKVKRRPHKTIKQMKKQRRKTNKRGDIVDKFRNNINLII